MVPVEVPLEVRVNFIPRERGIRLDPRWLEKQVSGFAARHPNLIQAGRLVRTMVESDDGTEWWWAFCSLAQSKDRRVLEVFELLPLQSTEMGRTWFDLIETCCEVYCARWRRSDGQPVSQLELGRAIGHVQRLIDSVEVFMDEVIPSQLSSDQLRQLEHLLHDAKRSLRQQQQMDNSTEYSALELEHALWAMHELLGRLGVGLELLPSYAPERRSTIGFAFSP